MRRPAEEKAVRWGLGAFRQQELEQIYDVLCQRISIGLQRSGSPTQTDGGLLAIRTGVPPMKLDDWQCIPQGSEAIVCTLGSTNLVVSHAIKEEYGPISVKELSKQVVSTEDYNVERFVQLIANAIVEVSHQHRLEHISALGVSLGFPHINESASYGIEGILTSAHLYKNWALEPPKGVEDRRIAKALMEQLVQRGGPQIKYVAFLNDACAVALDVGSARSSLDEETDLLQIGMVCGTGTNVCLGYQEEMVNLEIGDAPCEADPIMEEMIARGRFSPLPLLEYYTGMFIPYRVGTVLELLGEWGLVPQGKMLGRQLRQLDGSILSLLASRKVSVEDADDWGWEVPMTSEDLRLLQELARLALHKAGQVYGVILAAGVHQARQAMGELPQKGVVLAGGAVINKGYRVWETIQRTCEQLGQRQVSIVHSSGFAGIGAFVMKQSSVHR